MSRPLTIEKHDRERSRIAAAVRNAAYALASIQGQTAEEVAAAVAARAIAALRSKAQPEGQVRP